MRLRFVFALSVLGLVGASCAQGGALQSPDDGDNGGTTASGGSGQGGATTSTSAQGGNGGATTTSTGQGGSATTTTGNGGSGQGGATTTSTGEGGAGGATTTTTSTGKGGAGGATTTSSSTTDPPDAGPVCSEQPCKLVSPQCGCAAGKACVLTAAGARTCNLAGNAAWGAECSNVNRCQAGFDCVATGNTGTCFKFCAKDAECTAPGGLCVVTLVDQNQKPIPNATLCSPNCSPITNAGCPVAGTSCQLAQEQAGQQRFFTMCDGAGAGTQGAACSQDSDCAPMFGCFTDANQKHTCMRWCDASKQACPGGLSCAPLMNPVTQGDIVVGNVTYGVCQ
jgi:hypothetical protein